MRNISRVLSGLVIFASSSLLATETENLNLEILPAPGAVVVDGKANDWDLSGGVFACGDVENSATKYGVWFFAMYDAEQLYLLARWMDVTPTNHPGTVKGDYGFIGDCLQVRIVTAPDVTAPEVARHDRNANDAPKTRTTHLTAWRDRDKLDVVNLGYGRRFNEGGIGDAKTQGGAQAFLEFADGKGYWQEISLPWKLLVKPEVEVKAGSRVLLTIEPNFTVGSGGRLTIKDLFKPGVGIDRVFTFQGNGCWGFATLAEKGKVALRPVRLSDGREFAVRMEEGLPVVDWTGLIKSRLPDGFKPIHISLPEDGFVSLNIFAPDGTVARQLLTCDQLTKGEHDIKWDGLTTMSVRKPGAALPAGEYTYEGFYHTGIGLKLRGWAGNSGRAPWYGWGADHGDPGACATDGERVYLGWGSGEGDKPLQACDLNGNILWKNIRGGIASAGPIASDGQTVYAFNNVGQYAARAIYRLDARSGRYTEWSEYKNTDLLMKQIWGDEKDGPEQPSGLAASKGHVFVSFSGRNAVVVVDAKTGKAVKKLSVPKPSDMKATSATQLYVLSTGNEILSVNVETGESKSIAKPALAEKDWLTSLAIDKAGNFYVGVRGSTHQVDVYDAEGKFVRTIGRKGGRALLGPWTPEGMLNVSGLGVDAQGKLWVAEADGCPRRVSVWDTQTGAFKAEYFGASSYGAIGAAVNPQDPQLMVGQGCEWRIDPKTGKSVCLGVVTRDGMGASRFGQGNGKLFLAVTPGFLHGQHPVRIFERLGDANFKLRTIIYPPSKERKIKIWADANDDSQEQPEETNEYAIELGGWLQGWYMNMAPDLSFYGSLYKVAVTGYTACGAPQYDLSKAKKMAGPQNAGHRGGMGAQRGQGSADGKYMLYNACYGETYGTMDCYDIETGKFLWAYPSNFTGVHGSHAACAPEVGMLRGAYDITGTAKLPPPIGNVWVIPTNKGEWHMVTEKGFYLSRLFEGDPMKNVWPDPVVPGVSLDQCPPGAGEEAFGGSITQTADGGIAVQAGHISYWNAQVTGLETIKALPGGKITITDEDVKTAETFRERYLSESTTLKRMAARKATPAFTGDLNKDFAGAEVVKYQKQEATACRSVAAWDDTNLYLGWEVKDATPWVNGADAPEFLYARGDTVDLQLGTDPKAGKARKEAVAGDLRLSIGPFQGKPTAVIYRKVAAEKHPKSFSSGVVKNYQMDSVQVVTDAKIEVKVDPVNKRYIVEAAVPLAALGFQPASDLVIRADFGATHGDKTRADTVLRTHWSNQNTGLVSDEVFELQMAPAAWGEMQFK